MAFAQTSGAADPRLELAKAQAPVGLLQLPRSRGERLRHMEIIDRVLISLPGPIGKILRRHRKDSPTTLIHTMLKVRCEGVRQLLIPSTRLEACVEKRWDAMLWDTFANTVRQEQSHPHPDPRWAGIRANVVSRGLV
eukprot:Skav209476  [mRNA]  locus=scaffold1892:19797:21483:+ [translate_table: standard]